MRKSFVLFLVLSLTLLLSSSVLAQNELAISNNLDIDKLNKETEVVSVSFETKDKKALFGDLSDLGIQEKVSSIIVSAKELNGDYIENIKNSIINDAVDIGVKAESLNVKAGSIEELNREEKSINATIQPNYEPEKHVETIIQLTIEKFSVFNTHLKGTYDRLRYEDSRVYYINTQCIMGIDYHYKDSIYSNRLGAFAIFRDMNVEGYIIPSLLRADFKIGSSDFTFEGWTTN